jgi:hypothetical protein
MSGAFHEEFRQDEVKPPSERSTGMVFAAFLAILAVVWRHNLSIAAPIAGLALALTLMAWQRPWILAPLNLLWFRFGLLLHRIVNPVVMLALFAVAIVPAGLIMQRWRDPLVKRRKPAGQSYWIALARDARSADGMRHQF